MKFVISCVLVLALYVITNAQQERVVFLYNDVGSCTGVILQTNLILTCAHCVEILPKEAKVLKKDDKLDLALISMKTPVFERITLAETKVSDEVYSYGHPLGESTAYYSKGYVMAVKNDMTMTSIITLPGDSGSPLFSKDGLVGVIRGTVGPDDYQPISITVCSKCIKAFLGW